MDRLSRRLKRATPRRLRKALQERLEKLEPEAEAFMGLAAPSRSGRLRAGLSAKAETQGKSVHLRLAGSEPYTGVQNERFGFFEATDEEISPDYADAVLDGLQGLVLDG